MLCFVLGLLCIGLSIEFSEGIDVGVEEDFVEIGDTQLPDDDLVPCGSEFCAICNVDTDNVDVCCYCWFG